MLSYVKCVDIVEWLEPGRKVLWHRPAWGRMPATTSNAIIQHIELVGRITKDGATLAPGRVWIWLCDEDWNPLVVGEKRQQTYFGYEDAQTVLSKVTIP